MHSVRIVPAQTVSRDEPGTGEWHHPGRPHVPARQLSPCVINVPLYRLNEVSSGCTAHASTSLQGPKVPVPPRLFILLNKCISPPPMLHKRVSDSSSLVFALLAKSVCYSSLAAKAPLTDTLQRAPVPRRRSG
ncbi:hypothetical protein FKM82_020711 [Ascaphus truei]